MQSDTPPLNSLLSDHQIQQLAERIYRLTQLGKGGFGEVRIEVSHGKPKLIKVMQCDTFDLDPYE